MRLRHAMAALTPVGAASALAILPLGTSVAPSAAAVAGHMIPAVAAPHAYAYVGKAGTSSDAGFLFSCQEPGAALNCYTPQELATAYNIPTNLTGAGQTIVIVDAFGDPTIAQDVAAGKSSFNKCLACHAIGEGAKNKIGPELNGLDGRKAGTVEGFSYSDADKNSGITWNEAEFKDYIKDPRAKVPGTKMIFAGIKNEQEINDLWAYVSQFNADGSIKKK